MSVVIAATSVWERLAVLAPAIVIGVGLMLGALILLARGLAQTVRESGHKRAIFAGLAVLFALVVLLTYLGVQLPREG